MSQFGTAKRLWALDSPTFTVPAHHVMYGMEGELTIPLPAFLIEHSKGLVLFDTGIVPEAVDDPYAVFGEMAAMLGLTGSSELRVDRQIQALGYKLSDVTHVIVSHLHADHAGGLSLFPQAKLYVGAAELPAAYWPVAGEYAFRRADFQDIPRQRWKQIPGCDVDLFGDGSLVILSTPGHTPGELSLVVRLPSRNFVLTGDTAHLRAALELEIPFPLDVDGAQAVRSLQRVKLIRDSADATVWITHDPQDWAELSHAPISYE